MNQQAVAPSLSFIKDMRLFRQQCYINGEWRDADSGRTFSVDNPGTGKELGVVPDMGAQETREAIAAANAALPAWRGKTAKERAAILRKWHDLILENRDDLAVIVSLEQGKPLREAGWEIPYGASFVEWFSEEGKRAYGDTIPQHQNDKRLMVIKQPVGVCAAITPWNFPHGMVARKAAPALAAGCTMVLKPAEQTPYSALALCELAERAGIPKGVLNVITGYAPPIGKELTDSPLVRKLSFTGSTEIGKLLMSQCAGTVKKVSLELGGNAPFIVFDDADIDAAVEGAMISKYRLSGQTCVCANRIFVQDGIYDKFAAKLAEAVGTLQIGSAFESGVTLGPLIDMAAVSKVEEHIEDAVRKGAKLLAGGKRHPRGGSFFEPTVLGNATRDMKLAEEETFGPVAPLFRFRDEEELIRLANDTQYGLAAYFYTENIGRLWRVAEALEYGMVCVNTGILSTELAPFGGVKQSGIGREGSKYGIDEYLELKYICVGGIDK